MSPGGLWAGLFIIASNLIWLNSLYCLSFEISNGAWEAQVEVKTQVQKQEIRGQ